MAIRFDPSGFVEEDEDEQIAYEEDPIFPYPLICGQPDIANIRRREAHFSLVKLNINYHLKRTLLALPKEKTKNSRKVLFKIP